MSTQSLKFISAAVVAGVVIGAQPRALAGSGPIVIELTQTPCQFLESERGVDHGYVSAGREDCEAINQRTGDSRLAASKTLQLAPGKYVFRVTNKNVPYPLGFWLRGEGIIGRATLPSVSGGGLVKGATKDYAVDLEPGRYVYSCPLNPTPNYHLIVRDRG